MNTTPNFTSREGRRSLSLPFALLLFLLATQLFGASAINPAASARHLLDQADVEADVQAKVADSTDFNAIATCADLPGDLTVVKGIVEIDGDIICEQTKVIRVANDASEVLFLGDSIVHTKGIIFEIPGGKTMSFAAGGFNFEANEDQTDGIFLMDGDLALYASDYTYKAPPESKLKDRKRLVRFTVGANVYVQADSVMHFTDSSITVAADSRKSAAPAVARAVAASMRNKKEQQQRRQIDSDFSSITAGPPIKEANPAGLDVKDPRRQQDQQQDQQQHQESGPGPTTESSSSTAGTNTNVEGSQQHEENNLRQEPRLHQPNRMTTNLPGSTEPSPTTTGKRNYDDNRSNGGRQGSNYSDSSNSDSNSGSGSNSNSGSNNNNNGGDDSGGGGGGSREGGGGSGSGSGSGTDESFPPPEMSPHPGQSLKVGEVLTGFLLGSDQTSMVYSSRSDASVVFTNKVKDKRAREADGGMAGSTPPPGTTLIASKPRRIARAEKIRADTLEEDQERRRGAGGEKGGKEEGKGKMAAVWAWLPFGKDGWWQTRAREHARQHMGEVTLRITDRGVLEGTLDGTVVLRKGGRSILGWRPRDPSYEARVSEDGVEVTRRGKVIWSVTTGDVRGSRL